MAVKDYEACMDDVEKWRDLLDKMRKGCVQESTIDEFEDKVDEEEKTCYIGILSNERMIEESEEDETSFCESENFDEVRHYPCPTPIG